MKPPYEAPMQPIFFVLTKGCSSQNFFVPSMIVNYYGGTTPTARVMESRYPSHVYAGLGYIVYIIQPSGATGFGQEFSARHVNAWGKLTADEIIGYFLVASK